MPSNIALHHRGGTGALSVPGPPHEVTMLSFVVAGGKCHVLPHLLNYPRASPHLVPEDNEFSEASLAWSVLVIPAWSELVMPYAHGMLIRLLGIPNTRGETQTRNLLFWREARPPLGHTTSCARSCGGSTDARQWRVEVTPC